MDHPPAAPPPLAPRTPSFEQTAGTAVSVGDWLLTLLLMSLPIIGVIMLFVWAFGGGANPSKANWAKAMLLWVVIAVVLAFGFLILLGVIGALASSGASTR